MTHTSTTQSRHFTREEVAGFSTKSLKSIIASTNPTGFYAGEVAWAKQELERRGVDFSDCLEVSA